MTIPTMHCWLTVFLFFMLLLYRNNILAATFDLQNIGNDLTKFGIQCANDYCQFSQIDSLGSQACHCGMHCVQLGTCCFDSPYVAVPQPKRKPACRYVYNKGYYFIIHKCSFTDSIWASQCNDESSGDNDLQKLVPVTSLMTNITYKNYYCFRCYEAGDDFTYWTLNIRHGSIQFEMSEPESKDLSKHISYIYNNKKNSVMASFCGGVGYFSVIATMKIPPKVENLTHVCYEGVISDCSKEWSDEEIRNKCHSYMAIKEVERVGMSPVLYKNIHCALCNYENLNSVSCKKPAPSGYGSGSGGSGGYSGYSGYGGSGGAGAGGEQFSFDAVFNINPSEDSNNKQADNDQKCSDDQQECSDDSKSCSEGEKWNPFSRLCKKLTCLAPGHIVKGDKCVKE